MTAKIKLNAASGGGSISIQAPSSSSNNRIISLPDIADGTLLTSQSSLDSTKLSPAISAGITMADIWRINTDGTLGTDSVTNFTSNWERADTYGSGQIGSGMTESSGTFTFPSTGIYQITAMMLFKRNGGTNRFADLQLNITTNNSSYNVAATGSGSFAADFATNTAVLNYLFDVTSVSTHKVYFSAYTNRDSVKFLASTDQNAGSFTFIRLGDT